MNHRDLLFVHITLFCVDNCERPTPSIHYYYYYDHDHCYSCYRLEDLREVEEEEEEEGEINNHLKMNVLEFDVCVCVFNGGGGDSSSSSIQYLMKYSDRIYTKWDYISGYCKGHS